MQCPGSWFCPNAYMFILGETHPNLVRNQARPIARRLTARLQGLGSRIMFVFFDQFVDQATLIDFISSATSMGRPI